MAVEIERKFLVSGLYKSFAVKHTYFRQGYISANPNCNVRIRSAGEKGYITIKGRTNSSGMSRFEWEKEILADEAEELLQFCDSGIVEKIRHFIPVGNHLFEVDEFLGENIGLTVAEVELDNENDAFVKPPWLGKEVTGITRYYNSSLIRNPYSNWSKELKE